MGCLGDDAHKKRVKPITRAVIADYCSARVSFGVRRSSHSDRDSEITYPDLCVGLGKIKY